MKPRFRNAQPSGSIRKKREAAAAASEQMNFLTAHEAQRNRKPQEGDMPRALLEREVAEWMLADKQVHTGKDFGARPRDLPFAQFVNWNAPKVNDGGPLRPRTEVENRNTAAHIMGEAAKCAELFRAVIIQVSLDRYAGAGGAAWGTPKDDRRWARMFIEGEGRYWEARREELCGMAMIDPGALQRADKDGHLRTLSADAIGKKRYETRLLNAEATATQPDLFRSMGFAR